MSYIDTTVYLLDENGGYVLDENGNRVILTAGVKLYVRTTILLGYGDGKA